MGTYNLNELVGTAMLSLLLDDDAEGAGLVGLSLYKHGAKVLRGTQNAACQSVILLIFKKFQLLTPINVENRKSSLQKQSAATPLLNPALTGRG